MTTERCAGTALCFVILMVEVLVPSWVGAAAPGNDACASAHVVSTLPFSETRDITEATSPLSDPLICPGGIRHSNSVWYTFTATGGGTASVDTSGTDWDPDTDTVIAVFTGTCGALTPVKCDDDGGSGYLSKLTFSVSPGETYLVEVARWLDSSFTPPMVLHFNLKTPCSGKPDGAACDDDDPCTTAGACGAGFCNAGVPGNPCVVTGTNLLSDPVFDLGGAELQLAPGASLVREPGGSLTVQNTSGVTLGKGASIKSLGSGEAAGAIIVDSDGPCDIQGKINASGVANRLGGEGGPGGDVSLTCDGLTLGKTAAITAKGVGTRSEGSPIPAQGGSIHLSAGSGAFSAAKGAKLDARGTGSSGGSVTVDATSECSLGAKVYASSSRMSVPEDEPIGGSGGSLVVTCGGDATLGEGAKVVTGSVKAGTGGTVDLTTAGSLTMDARAKIQNNGVAGILNATSAGACSIDGKIASDAKGGAGGTSSFACTSFALGMKAKIAAKTKGDQGGSLLVAAPGGCQIAGKVLLGAGAVSLGEGEQQPGTGGVASFDCGASLAVDAAGSIDVSGSGGAAAGGSGGGSIGLVASGAVAVDGQLKANGKGPGGTIDIEGCDVTIGAISSLSANGSSGGSNALTAHHQLTVNGAVSALNSSSEDAPGTNSLVYRDLVSIGGSAVIRPASTAVNDGGLAPCP